MSYLIFITCFLLSFSAVAFDKACLLTKYENYVAAQDNWQKGLTDMIVTNHADLRDVAELYLNDQLVLTQKRLMAVTSLLNETPEKLQTHLKVASWLQLDAADETELASNNPLYDELLQQHLVNRHREPHVDGNRLRDVMRTQVTLSNEFKHLYVGFLEQVNDINNIVCAVK
ncbi:hypothetical protein [Paraglaciecola marina]|uniref:hypothetical protein n=1 Tax=Paraglaciecola marina TaxID=2500157 RepID=UPI00105D5817|nr:hypothetical protein [Paraglaciecola marina]